MEPQTEIDSESAIYLAQLSGNAYLLGILKDYELELAFKLNSLFFDELIVGAGSLIGSPFLYSLSQSDPQTMKEIYRSKLVRPLMREKDDATDITSTSALGRRMYENDTETVFPRKYILKEHGEFIEECGAEIAWAGEDAYQENYFAILTFLVKRSIDQRLFSTEDRIKVSQFLDQSYNAGQVAFDSMSELHRFLNRSVSDSCAFEIKKQSEFAAQNASSWITSTKLSIPDPISGYLSLMAGNEKPKGFFDAETRTLDFPLSILSLVKFPMSDILRIRKAPEFKRLRLRLREVRRGELLEQEEARDLAYSCLSDLQKLVKAAEIHREDIIREIENKNVEKTCNIMLSSIAGASISYSIFEIINGTDTNISLFADIGVMLSGYLIGKHFRKHKEYAYDTDAKFNVEEGVLKILQE